MVYKNKNSYNFLTKIETNYKKKKILTIEIISNHDPRIAKSYPAHDDLMVIADYILTVGDVGDCGGYSVNQIHVVRQTV